MNIKTILTVISIMLLSISCEEISLNTLKDLQNGLNPPPGPPNLVSGSEWIEVPANSGSMGLPKFYVMKYEAKAMLNDESSTSTNGAASPATHKPISIADNQPWNSINAHDAAAECESLGSGYHLISNPEWMAIARNIENVATNWIGGSIGSGCLFRGNSQEATGGDGTGPSDSCGYTKSGVPSENDSGSNRDIRAKHTLSNGLEIYDLAGNIAEWVDWDKDTIGFQIGPTTCAGGDQELTAVNCPALADSDFDSASTTYSSSQGVGYFIAGNGGAALRGGLNGADFYTGIFALFLDKDGNSGLSYNGFRCVYRP